MTEHLRSEADVGLPTGRVSQKRLGESGVHVRADRVRVHRSLIQQKALQDCGLVGRDEPVVVRGGVQGAERPVQLAVHRRERAGRNPVRPNPVVLVRIEVETGRHECRNKRVKLAYGLVV